MANFGANALKVLQLRYLAWIDGKQETVDQFIERVSMGNPEYKAELIEPLNFLPNSPTLFNLDVPGGGTLSACFKFDVSDTMLDGTNGIMETATKAAMVTKWGGGVGYYLGDIRPKNSLVNSTHGKAMGPVALLKFYHAMGSMLTQSGKRDAAQMGILPATHPDIAEFISCKDDDPQGLSTFNISVSLSDEFMERAKVSGSPESNVLRDIARSAWRTGDPGVYFVTRAERDNPTPEAGLLTGTNPCGEVPLLNNEPCNLGSINLRNFYDPDTFISYERLERVTHLATRFLDDVLDHNHFPVPEVTAAALYTRKLGLGVCGWADLLALHHMDYASDQACQKLSEVMEFIRKVADETSIELGTEKGVAPCFIGTGTRYRNATRLCIAPTGTIAILMGASSGIEPHYLLSWDRTTAEGVVLHETVPVLDELEDWLPGTAMDIPWEYHVKMQAAAQPYVDLAVSKTINMPNSATEEDIFSAYIMMWETGCKGGTIYRNGSREFQVLNEVEQDKEPKSDQEEGTRAPANTGGEECPECGSPVKHEEQCTECVSCGWSACSV